MRRLAGCALLAAIALGACGDKGTGGEEAASSRSAEAISRAEVARRAQGAIRPEPGKYRTTVEMIDLDVPGIPAGQADMMKNMMERNDTVTATGTEYCLTPEDVSKGYREMFRNSQKGDCTYHRFDVEGGNVDAEMTCQTVQGEAHMTMSGTVTPTSSNMDMRMEQPLPGMGKANVHMKLHNQRIGDCG